MERWPFYLGTGTIMVGTMWTSYTSELGAGIIFAIWGGALIIKDAINDMRVI